MTYHDVPTLSQPRPGRPSRWRVLGGLAVVMVGACGCVAARSTLPLVAFDTEGAGTKMLRPGGQASACATRVLGIARGDGASPLVETLRQLLALDTEANTLTNVTIETRTLALGVCDRTCVTVRADVVRTTSVVRLPAPPGHEGHHH